MAENPTKKFASPSTSELLCKEDYKAQVRVLVEECIRKFGLEESQDIFAPVLNKFSSSLLQEIEKEHPALAGVFDSYEKEKLDRNIYSYKFRSADTELLLVEDSSDTTDVKLTVTFTNPKCKSVLIYKLHELDPSNVAFACLDIMKSLGVYNISITEFMGFLLSKAEEFMFPFSLYDFENVEMDAEYGFFKEDDFLVSFKGEEFYIADFNGDRTQRDWWEALFNTKVPAPTIQKTAKNEIGNNTNKEKK